MTDPYRNETFGQRVRRLRTAKGIVDARSMRDRVDDLVRRVERLERDARRRRSLWRRY